MDMFFDMSHVKVPVPAGTGTGTLSLVPVGTGSGRNQFFWFRCTPKYAFRPILIFLKKHYFR